MVHFSRHLSRKMPSGFTPKAVGGLERELSFRKPRFCPEGPGKLSPSHPPPDQIANKTNYGDQNDKGSGCSDASTNLLGFCISRLYVVIMLFHPESYKKGFLPSLERHPVATQEHKTSSWLPCWTISWPQLKNKTLKS